MANVNGHPEDSSPARFTAHAREPVPGENAVDETRGSELRTQQGAAEDSARPRQQGEPTPSHPDMHGRYRNEHFTLWVVALTLPVTTALLFIALDILGLLVRWL